jgi:hypothetical protein
MRFPVILAGFGEQACQNSRIEMLDRVIYPKIDQESDKSFNE